MNYPLVSLIVPTYNYAGVITECLSSIAAQGYPHWECIIVNDGSTDATIAVVEDFMRSRPDLAFRLVNIANSGTSAAKNLGLSLAKGTYIQFLDADDLLSPDKISIQVRCMQSNPRCALVFCRSQFFLEHTGNPVPGKYPPGYLAEESLQGDQLMRRLIAHNLLTIGSPLFRSDLAKRIGGFSAEIRHNEDWLFWFMMAIEEPDFCFDQEAGSFVQVRIHSRSAMTNSRMMAMGEVEVRKKMDQSLSGALKQYNLDLLALHQIRSVDAVAGYSYIFSNFANRPLHQTKLLGMGLYRTLVRIFKKATRS